MKIRRLFCAISMVALVASTTTPAAAAEVDPLHHNAGWAGGTFVSAVGGAVRSDVTASAWLSGSAFPAHVGNKTLGVTIPGLVSADLVSTSGDADRDSVGDLVQTMTARTVGLSLLDGLITADALETDSTVKRRNGAFSGQSETRLVDLKIAGEKLPVRLPANTKITVPGIVEVTVNESSFVEASGGASVTGSALKVRLLRAIDGSEPGTVVTVNPTHAAFERNQPSDATPVGGRAYVTSLDARAASATVHSGPTSPIAVPRQGTNGHRNLVSLARVTLPGLISTGAVETSAQSTSVPLTADVTHTAEVARLSVLGGLLSADAIKVSARVLRAADGGIVRQPVTRIVGLRVVGLPINLDVPRANLALSLPGLLSITLNEQIATPNGVKVTGLRVRLLRPVGTLPAGADLRVAYAESSAG